MATRKLKKTLIFHHFEFFGVKWQRFFRSKKKPYTIPFFMFMGGDWKQLYTPYWIRIILLFLTKCSIVYHVGFKKSYNYWMPNCTPCLMWDILLLLHAQIWVMGGTCSKLPRAIQSDQKRKWVTKPRTSWKNVGTLKIKASKQQQKDIRMYIQLLLRG